VDEGNRWQNVVACSAGGLRIFTSSEKAIIEQADFHFKSQPKEAPWHAGKYKEFGGKRSHLVGSRFFHRVA
jgi:hypothetical protein